MRIVLYNPRSNSARKRIMPFSLLAIGAVLEGEFEYEIVDGNAESDPDAALKARLGSGAAVFGMTVMPGPQLEDAFLRTRTLKTADPKAIVIWGGYFPTEHAEACLTGASGSSPGASRRPARHSARPGPDRRMEHCET